MDGGPSYSLTLHGDLAVYGMDHRLKMEKAAFVSVVGKHLRRQVQEQTCMPYECIFETCMGVDTSVLKGLGEDRSYAPGLLHLVTVARLNPAKGPVNALKEMDRQDGVGIYHT